MGSPSRLCALLLVAFALTVSVTRVSAEPLVAGGLTALPAPYGMGPTLVDNGGFETLLGGIPKDWSITTAFGTDQLIRRSGLRSLRLSNASLGQYTHGATQSIELTTGTYRLRGWIKTDKLGANQAGSGVRLRLDTSTNGGGGISTPVIRGTTAWTYYEQPNIVIAQNMTAKLKIEAYGSPSGQAWFDDVSVEEQLPAPIQAFMLYPNYRGMLFEDQPLRVKLDLVVRPPQQDFARYSVQTSLTAEATGTLYARTTVASQPAMQVEVDASVLARGIAYRATVRLIDKVTGATVYTASPYRISRVSAATRDTMNIAFDDKNRILVHGEPRFILGVYDSGLSYSTTDAFWEQTLWSPTGSRRMDGLAINFYLNYWMGGADATSMNALMTNLAKRGVMYAQTGNCVFRSPSTRAAIDLSDDYVRDIGSHPASGGYYTADECDPSLIPSTFAQYDRLRRLDPDSMTIGTLLAGTGTLPLWRDAVDVLMTDPYPLYGAEPEQGYPHSMVADWTERAREAVKDARPFMIVLQFFKFTSQGRWPTRQEMRNHAYTAIVEGAKGLWWWSVGGNALASVCTDWCPEKVAHLNDLKAVVGEIADLEPVLVADSQSNALVASTPSASIRTMTKVVDGRGYVVAYNATGTATTASFTWHTGVSRVAVYGENRTVSASGSSFSDVFDPYEAHVYVIESGSAPAAGTFDLLAPIGAVSQTTPKFQWTALPGASLYVLRLQDGRTGLVTSTYVSASSLGCSTGTCTLTAPTPLTLGEYKWWVASHVSGSMRFSETVSFVVDP